MPAINGVVETCLYVDDLARAACFYQDVLGFRKLAADERFCALSVADRDLLLLFRKGGTLEPAVTPGGTIPPHDGAGEQHVAFGIPRAAAADWQRRLEQSGIAIESTVDWPSGGHSLYFRDPDRNLLELMTPGVWPIY